MLGFFVRQQKSKLMTLPLKAQQQSSFIGTATGIGIKRRDLTLKDLREMKRIVEEELERQKLEQEEKQESEVDSIDLTEEEDKEEQKQSQSEMMPPGESAFVHRDTIADMSRGNTSKSKYDFADDSDSDDEGAILTRNSGYYRGDELDLDQKNMRNTLAMGNVLNIDQMKSVKQGEEIYLQKIAAEEA